MPSLRCEYVSPSIASSAPTFDAIFSTVFVYRLEKSSFAAAVRSSVTSCR